MARKGGIKVRRRIAAGPTPSAPTSSALEEIRAIALDEEEIVRPATAANHFTDTIKMLASRAEMARVRRPTLCC